MPRQALLLLTDKVNISSAVSTYPLHVSVHIWCQLFLLLFITKMNMNPSNPQASPARQLVVWLQIFTCPSVPSALAEIHLKKFSTSLVIREMHIKTTLKFHLTPLTMAKINDTSDSSCRQGFGAMGTILCSDNFGVLVSLKNTEILSKVFLF